MMSFVDFEANAVVPEHSHPQEQMGMVRLGEFELTIGNETRCVKEGDIFLIPAGVPHSVRVGDKPAKALDIFSPPRDDYKFQER